MKKNKPDSENQNPEKKNGGARPGAGRKPIFGDEPTKRVRIPVRCENNFRQWLNEIMVKK